MRRPIAGFTMVEVLVAVLLLAVGLVGALAMQAYAMRTRQETALQTEALQAAATLADRIRANAAQSSSYLGFEFSATELPPAEPGSAPGACAGTPCDAAALAQRELDDFRLHLQSSLPGCRAIVCRDASAALGGHQNWACADSANAPIVIKIGWRSHQPGARAADIAPQVTLPVALPPAPATPPVASPTGGAP